MAILNRINHDYPLAAQARNIRLSVHTVNLNMYCLRRRFVEHVAVRLNCWAMVIHRCIVPSIATAFFKSNGTFLPWVLAVLCDDLQNVTNYRKKYLTLGGSHP